MSRPEIKKIDIPCRLISESPKAWKMDVGLKDEVWLPKSQCSYNEQEGIITVPEWIAIEKGMENLV